MSRTRVFILTTLAMLAFAGNSLLCRLALKNTGIDAASFTSIRLIAGAITLYLFVYLRNGKTVTGGNWLSAFALFAYAAGFSFAYLHLSAATGALLLFTAVQTSMIGYSVFKGERLHALQILGLVIAFSGLIALLLPGLASPPGFSSLLMVCAGIAWGIYSLRGKTAQDATAVTAGNFLRAIPFALALSMAMFADRSFDNTGIMYAILSGALASGIGYAIWYSALPALKAGTAASVQLTVPAIAAGGGILLLDEPASLRLVLASVAILGGIALVIFRKK
ncbi:MAG: DMT family transporter [Arenimonas sp.]